MTMDDYRRQAKDHVAEGDSDNNGKLTTALQQEGGVAGYKETDSRNGEHCS